MIRPSHEDSDGVCSRRWGISATAALVLCGAMLFPLCAHAGSIFDDDYTPPAPVKPAMPPADAPEVKPTPEPAKPNTPDTAKPDVPATPPANVPLPAVPDVVPAAPKPIPPPAARTKSKAIFDELYAKELADHTPAARRALAAKLIDQAAGVADNPSDQYMLLVGATTAGKDASDLGVCFRAADAMADTFEVDSLRFKSETATKMKLRAETLAVTADNCQAALKLVDQDLAADDYVNAQAIIKALRTTTPDAALTSQIQSRVKAIETLRVAEERVAPYIQKLKTAPDDATANLEVGRYLCFIKGDWKQGCFLLAKGGKTGASAVAALDLAGASDPQKQVDLGDAWWNLSDKETGPAQFAMRQRAANWYSMGLEGQTVTGLKRVLLEKRVAAAAEAHLSSPSTKALPRAVLNLGGDDAAKAVLQGLGAGRFIPGDAVAVLGNPSVYKQVTIVVWGPNTWRATKRELFTDTAEKAMQQFVSNGGDIVIFEQFGAQQMDVFEHAFGVKTIATGDNGANIVSPALRTKVGTDGVTQDDLNHVKFYNIYENLPKGSVVLVRTLGGNDVVVSVPYGTGHIIMSGTNFDESESKLNDEILDFTYHWKRAKR